MNLSPPVVRKARAGSSSGSLEDVTTILGGYTVWVTPTSGDNAGEGSGGRQRPSLLEPTARGEHRLNGVHSQPAAGRWTALVFIALAQLMIALDAKIMTSALPSAQASLGASAANRQLLATASA